jgi:hypothetical protein
MKKLLDHLPPLEAWPYIAFGLISMGLFVAAGGLSLWAAWR